MTKKDLFRKLLNEIGRMREADRNLPLDKIITSAMDHVRIPDDNEGTRAGYRFAAQRILDKEKNIPREEKKNRSRKLKKPGKNLLKINQCSPKKFGKK